MARTTIAEAGKNGSHNRIKDLADDGVPNKEKKQKEAKGGQIQIKPLNYKIVTLWIVGTEPLITHSWSEKAKRQMLEGQQKEPGITTRKPREKRDPEADYNGARYIYKDKKGSWDGFPAVAMKAALVGACRQVEGITLVEAKRSIFVKDEGKVSYNSPYSAHSFVGLVRIYGEPQMREDPVRINKGSDTSLAYRPQYWPWSAKIRVEFNADRLSEQAIVNLVSRAGKSEGIGEWRPSSKESLSGQLGTWEVDDSRGVQIDSGGR